MKKKIITILLVFGMTITTFFSSCINTYANPLIAIPFFSISEELFSLIVGSALASGIVLSNKEQEVSFVNTFLSQVSSDDFTVDQNGEKIKFPFNPSSSKADSAQYSTALEKFARRNVKKENNKFIPNKDFVSFFNKTVSSAKKSYGAYDTIYAYDHLWTKNGKNDYYVVVGDELDKNKKEVTFIRDILGTPYNLEIVYSKYGDDYASSIFLRKGSQRLAEGADFDNYKYRISFYPSTELPGYYSINYPKQLHWNPNFMNGDFSCARIKIPMPFDGIENWQPPEGWSTIDDNSSSIPKNDFIVPNNQDFGNFEGSEDKPVVPDKPDKPNKPPQSDIDFNFDWHKLDLNNFNLKNKFPFSLPWDLANIIGIFDVKPKVPVFDFPLPAGNHLKIDLTQFNDWAEITRFFVLIFFIIELIFITKKIM